MWIQDYKINNNKDEINYENIYKTVSYFHRGFDMVA